MKLHERIRASVFMKVLLLFITAFAVILVSTTLLHTNLTREQRFPKIQRNSLNYCRLLAEEIGTPPDTTFAAFLMDSIAINLRIQSTEMNWTSMADVPQYGESDIPEFSEYPGSHVGLDRGMIVEFTRRGYQYTFLLERREEGFIYVLEMYGVLLLLFFTVILVTVYMVVRRILRPIQILDAGVQELASGNLDHEITLKRRDELGDLVSSFNTMAGRLRMMLQARDRLLLDVSHELRSPLTRMKVATEFLQEDSVRKNLSEDIHQMETMLTEMLETERLKSAHGDLHIKDVNLTDLLQDSAAEFEGRMPGIALQDLPPDVMMQGDADRLRILFRNILGNAIKFSPEEGPLVKVEMQCGTEEYNIFITDSGPGIPADELPFIFEPFYRVDKSRAHDTGGYGLGLSICKTIAEHHGGRIKIASSEGEGTRVALVFPAG